MVYGAKLIAQALHDLGVKVIFGLPGLPVTDIGQEGLYLGIRFISFRNEQAAVYAAVAYGYQKTVSAQLISGGSSRYQCPSLVALSLPSLGTTVWLCSA